MSRKKQVLNEFLNQVAAIDTESTGLDPKSAEICEIATSRYDASGKIATADLLMGTEYPIPYMASSKNNISREMLKGLPLFKDSLKRVNEVLGLRDTSLRYLVAHNYQYDKTILESTFNRLGEIKSIKDLDKKKWLCTYRLSKHLFKPNEEDPDLNYQLNYLRYSFNLPADGMTVHRAGDDSAVCLMLLKVIAEVVLSSFEDTFDDLPSSFSLGDYLIEIANSPIIYDVMPFGKHKGLKMTEVPDEYFKWMLNKSNILDEKNDNYDPDFAASVEAELNRRMGN